MRRRTDLPRLDYNWYTIWSLWLRWYAYSMFSCPGDVWVDVSWIFLCLADLQAFMAVRLISWNVPADCSGRQNRLPHMMATLESWRASSEAWSKPDCIQFQHINMQTFMATNNLYDAVSLPIWAPLTTVFKSVYRYTSIYGVPNGVSLWMFVRTLTQNKNCIPGPLIQADLDHRCSLTHAQLELYKLDTQSAIWNQFL